MFLIIIVAALIGIYAFRFWDYWQWVISAFLWAALATLFLATGGSEQSPAGDGLFTFLVRRFVGPLSVENWIITIFNVVAWIIFGLILVRAAIAAWVIWRSDRLADYVGSNRKIIEALVIVVFLVLCQLPVLIGKPADFSGPLVALLGKPPAQAAQTEAASTEAPADPIAANLSAASEEENKTLPRKIDNITTLSKTSVEGRTWTSHYSVDLDPAQREAAIAFASETAPRHACANQVLRQNMRDNQVVYVFRYLIGGDPTPHSVSVTEAQCLEMGI